ncbi:MAG TPA: hypothetical protein VM122_01820 [Usitatibacter sp.]|nr:hypothetical protein [Usitatibacter sp.]
MRPIDRLSLGIFLVSFSTAAFAADTVLPAECANLPFVEQQDLRLAARAQEGEASFMSYVRLKRQSTRVDMNEAVERARVAAASPCGKAMGFRPVDAKLLPNLSAGEPKPDDRPGDRPGIR